MARNYLEIDLRLIRQNYQTICKAVSPLASMAVLKANAYGLGVLEVFQALKECGCHFFGVADLEEALQISGKGHETCILGDIMLEELSGIVQHGIVAPVTSLYMAECLNTEAQAQGKKARVQFLIDTGMGRLGVPENEALDLILACRELTELEMVGIYSHFPFAYGDKEFSEHQVEGFKDLLCSLDDAGINFEQIHIANSDGIHNIAGAKKKPFNMVRTGINLYGCFDLEGQKNLQLEPVLTLKSRLIVKRDLPVGATLGYGRTCTLEKATTVGTVAIGYADGLPISLSNQGFLLIDGIKCPILGRVSMDYTMIDLSDVPQAKSGDTVICLGEGIPVSEWAKSSGTITYDIICSIGNRVKRVYIES